MAYNFYYDRNANKKSQSMFFDAISDLPITNIGTMDPTTAIGARNSRWITFNIPAIDALSRSNPYVRKASKFLSSKVLINGIDLNSPKNQLTSEEEFVVIEKLKTLYGSMRDVLSKGYIYGGSAGIMWFSDQQTEEELMKPLIVSKIKKGTFMGIKPLARWFQVEPALEEPLIEQVGGDTGFTNAKKIGMPMYYNVNLSGGLIGDQKRKQFKVHASRLLLYNEDQPSFIETQIERFWGPSAIEVAWNDLAKDSRLWNAITKSAEKNNMGILKIDGLGMATQQLPAVTQRIETKLEYMKYGAAWNTVPIDGKDSFEFANSNLSGVHDVLSLNNSRIAGAFRVPVELFFPDTKGNDEDKSYMSSYTELLDNQNRILREWYDILIPVIIKGEIGRTIKNLLYSFNPIENISMKEKAEIAKINSDTMKNIYEIGGTDKAGIIKMLDVISKDPNFLSQNINPKYKEEILKKAEKGEFETHNTDQIDVAEALNKLNDTAGVHNPESDIQGKNNGGNPKEKKKPLRKKDKGE